MQLFNIYKQFVWTDRDRRKEIEKGEGERWGKRDVGGRGEVGEGRGDGKERWGKGEVVEKRGEGKRAIVVGGREG